MESGNSSSMQSSSGGDDQEYESNFPTTNTNTSNMFVFSSTPQHQPYLQQQPFGDPNFQNIIFWQQPHLGSGSSIPDPPPTAVTTSCTPTAKTTLINPRPPPSLGGGGGSGSKASTSGAGGSGNTSTNTKNPRKRTRASRRAPTTVLTTNTTNFRAMVQEFTGIPSSPFSASASPLLSRRLNDLFASPAPTTLGLMGPTPTRPVTNTTTSNLDRLISSGAYNYHHLVQNNNANAISSVNYPFRPCAQKPDLQMPVFLPKFSTTSTGPVLGSGLNIQDPGINNPNPDLRYPSGGLFTPGSSHFNDLLMGNEQQHQQQQQQQRMISHVTQHDAFPGIRLGSEPDPVGGSIPRSSTSTNDDHTQERIDH